MSNAKTARAIDSSGPTSTPADSTDSTGSLLLSDLLETLGYRDDEFVAVCHQPPGGEFRTAAVIPPGDTPAVVERLGDGVNIWFGVNPTVPPTTTGARGTSEQVTRLAALYADLDVKPGACADLAVAEKTIDLVSILLGQRPTVIVYSGHGLQPIWTVEDGAIGPSFTTDDAKVLLRRFGRLVAHVAEEHHQAAVDSVFDPARVLRVPGTVNHKGTPVPTGGRHDVGGPLTVAEIDEKLTEYGVDAQPDDVTDYTEQSSPDGWTGGATTCQYELKVLAGLPNDGPRPGGGRNPWACSQAVRLYCALRLGCITVDDFNVAVVLLADRLNTLLITTEPRRPMRRYEIRDIHALGRKRAAAKTDEAVWAELGDHRQLHPEFDFWGMPTTVVDGSPVVEPTVADGGPLCVEHLENGFWDSRESLRTVYQMALARMASPWATLAVCAARALTHVRPHVVLPPLIGSPGSLNWFGALVDDSGGGKGAAMGAARALVSEFITEFNLGSGEGVVKQYFPKPDSECPEGVREAVLFNAAEIDGTAALAARAGSTLMAVIRMGFSGEPLGFSTVASAGKHLPAHTYRMTLLMSIQPKRAKWLLSEADGGTPQRVMWFPARDRRVKAAVPWEPGPLKMPSINEWRYPRVLAVPDVAATLIRNESEKRHAGLGDALDGHAVFCREKFAYALTVLDGRTEMTIEDWELSGIAAAVSTHIRDGVVDILDEAERADAEDAGVLRGVSMAAADGERLASRGDRPSRVRRRALELIDGADGRIRNRELTKKIAYRDRGMLKLALDSLQVEKLLKLDDDGLTWVRL